MEIHGARVPKGRRQSDAQMEQDRDRTLPSSTAVSISEIIEERRVARQSEIVLPSLHVSVLSPRCGVGVLIMRPLEWAAAGLGYLTGCQLKRKDFRFPEFRK